MAEERIWINGETMPLAEARIGVEDRGFQFADGVYEVVRIYNGQPFALTEHLQRLAASAAGIKLSLPIDLAALADAIGRQVQENRPADGMVYLQLTRGVSPRNHLFPAPANSKPTLLFYTRSLPPLPAMGSERGLTLITVPDERWKRCWVKSIALLANVLAKNAATEAGADEAIFVDDGIVSECSTSNLFAIIDQTLLTHPVGPRVLGGITRLMLLQCAARIGMPFIERPVTLDQLLHADEVFITSTTREISWVSEVDGTSVGRPRGSAGPATLALHTALRRMIGPS